MKKLFPAIIIATAFTVIGIAANAQTTFAQRDSLSRSTDFRQKISWAAGVRAINYVNDSTSLGWLADFVIAEPDNSYWITPFARYAAQQTGVSWTPTDAQFQTTVNVAFPSVAAILSRRLKGK